ncbi:hypothetical protein GCM10009721_06230 [Terrabacter tumescens]|uniref:Uncharacterized protein n=1 Tax=Terrabacter tumescens TaxID=60443 RepID=A0ABQ2HLV0_9MICO|nr:hypothetical protein [Terrabacter tumescens]GGM84245.1 hypothetical protein GCM10009721_06230 [Terrabacter tumescens]
MSEQQPQQPRRTIAVTHTHGGLGSEALLRQGEHRRIIEARGLADRVAAIEPRPPAPAATLDSPVPPAPSSSRTARTPRPSGPIVVNVAEAKARQEQRAAHRAELDRIESAIDAALRPGEMHF